MTTKTKKAPNKKPTQSPASARRSAEKADAAKRVEDRIAKKGPRAKQTHLPDMAPPSIKAIDDAAEEYAKIRDERAALTPREVAAKDRLLTLMKSNDLTVYRFDSKIVEVVPEGETVKVKAVKTDGDDKPKRGKKTKGADNGDEG